MTLPSLVAGPVRNDAAVRRLAELASDAAGLSLSPEKYPMVRTRLARRLKALGLSHLEDYVALIDGPDGGAELPFFLGAVTTHVSAFFREPHHFARLRDSILPPLIARARAGGRVRLWSAGCAAGQEAWSLAMTVSDICPDASGLDLLILATDIDQRAIEQAAIGHYPKADAAQLPRRFRPGLGRADASRLAMPAALHKLVRFRRHNLATDWPWQGQFDVILCRNVLIYLRPDAQERLIERFTGALKPGAWLILGHTERPVGRAAAKLRPTGQTIWHYPGSAPGGEPS